MKTLFINSVLELLTVNTEQKKVNICIKTNHGDNGDGRTAVSDDRKNT
jgi:hypothetical protein